MTPFGGRTYHPPLDKERLLSALESVRQVMADGQWRTLREIDGATGGRYSTAGISARLRDLRKPRFGFHQIERRRIPASPWTWQYRMVSTPTHSASSSSELKP